MMIALYGNVYKTSTKAFLLDIDFLSACNMIHVKTHDELYKYDTIVLIELDVSLIEKLLNSQVNNIFIVLEAGEENQLKEINIELLSRVQVFNLGGNSQYTTNIPYISRKYSLRNNKDVFHYTTFSHNTSSKIFLKTDYFPNAKYKDMYDIKNEYDYSSFLGGVIEIESNTRAIDKIIIDAIYNESKINFVEKLDINSYEYFIRLLKKSHHIVADEINIVCHQPSYLFEDLCERFKKFGAVVSDYPLKNMKAYIWMRPQELSKYISGISCLENTKEKSKDIYIRGISNDRVQEDYLISNSVAIHHGTCYKPIVQFDDVSLSKSLFRAKKVVGVCEFEECYGESYKLANRENFEFIPIGYDHSLFSADKVRKETKKSKAPINIGFVGRAYGTNDVKLLSRSLLAHPKGYRKGGDILLNVALRLKLENINFTITILGNNWEELTTSFDTYGIDYRYYTRDQHITYEEYPKIYSTFDVLFIGARCEGGPVSAIEAMSLGVNVVSTDVGVVKYLDKISNGCNSFEFDRKWHTVDYDQAVNIIRNIYNMEITFNDRLKIRSDVESFTTDNWVESIIRIAKA